MSSSHWLDVFSSMPVVARMDWSRAVQLAEAQGERLTLDAGLYTFQVDLIDVTLAS